MASGFGRGGRGALLLQAIEKQARRPGEDDTETEQKPAPAPMGRGAFLAGLLQSKQPATSAPSSQPAPAAAGGSPVAPARPLIPMGRGVADMQAMLQASGYSLPSAARGSSFKSVPPVAAGAPPAEPSARPKTSPPPTAPVSPHAGGDARAPPTSRFARMSMEGESKTIEKSHGTDGQPVPLSANSIRLKCQTEGIFQYHVDFNPQVDSKGMRIRMVNEHRDVIGSTKAFDGSILYLPIRLPQEEMVLTSTKPTDQTQVSVIIRLVKVLKPGACTQLYNIIFRRIMSILNMVQVGRYFYNPATPSSVPQHKLEVWPGYITAVSEQEGGVLLLADASHRVLRTETVLEVMKNIVNRNPQGFRKEVIQTLVGTIILTRYNNKTYRIDDIAWDKSPQHTFSTSSGEDITFMDYYKKAYNKAIQDTEQPLLLHMPKQRQEPGQPERKSEVICLIPELCYMTGLNDALRSDFRVMKDLAAHTRVTPEQRRLTMKKFADSIMGNPDAKQQLESWGLELDNDTVNFDGRLLPQEKIVFLDRQTMAGENADWTRDATNNHVLKAVAIKNWLVLYTKRDQGKANDYIAMMMKVCPQMGIEVSAPTRFELRDDRTETFVRALRDNINPRIQMVVVICPTSRDDRYSAIKTICCVEAPVPSQVIIGKTIGNAQKLRSVTQKIALQINCKLGGELWGLSIPMKKLMVCGIDVYHDTGKKKNSIAGFVASTNSSCTSWFSRVAIQPVNQELVDGLKLCLTSAITKYHEIPSALDYLIGQCIAAGLSQDKSLTCSLQMFTAGTSGSITKMCLLVNHYLPEKIFVFRDGVGDGQLNTVANYEVQQLCQCFKHFGEDYSPRLAVIIVQKRINTKIFQRTPRQLMNPSPGTVVDHTITRRDMFDFFLVSQHVRQGTVSPTHYIVIHDSTGLKTDNMQRLTYKMTHLYYNWPGTVRVPAPCQYAHKLAQLVGQNIHKEPSKELSDRLFFL